MDEKIEIQRIPPRPVHEPGEYTYIVQMLDGRELELRCKGSLALAMSQAREPINDVKAFYAIGDLRRA